MLDSLCRQCNICWDLMKEPKDKPVLSISEDTPAPILVVDDCGLFAHYGDCIEIARQWLGDRTEFDYTTTIRCSHRTSHLIEENVPTILSRCSVWTRTLLEGRRMILTTERGLAQMKLETEHRAGDVFRNSRFGIVVVIPSLMDFVMDDTSEAKDIYGKKVQRALKELSA